MKFLSLEKLSKNMHVDNSGYLICENAVLARTGTQQYRHNELFQDSEDDSIIDVDRPENEVFDEKTLASFENKPICDEHPDVDVTPENYKDLSVGFVRDVRKGIDNGQPVMMGTLVITDADAIEEVKAGKRQLSCGYDCDLQDGDNGMYQCHIRGNHVALCEEGRAGIARIVDSKVNDANKKIENIISYFDAWGYPVGKELQEAVDFYKMTKSDVEKVFGPRIGRTYDKSELAKLKTFDSINDKTYKEYFIPKGTRIEGFNSCPFGSNKELIPGPSFIITSKDIKAVGTHEVVEQLSTEFDKKYGTPKGTRWSPEGHSKYVVNVIKDSYYTENEKSDKEFVKNALSEMRYYERNWNYLSKEDKRNIQCTLSELKSRIKELEQIDINDSVNDGVKVGAKYKNKYGTIAEIDSLSTNKTYVNVIFTRTDGSQDVKTIKTADVERILYENTYRLMKDSINDSYDISYNLGHAIKTEHFNNKEEADERYAELLQLSKKPSMSGLDVKKLYNDSIKDDIEHEVKQIIIHKVKEGYTADEIFSLLAKQYRNAVPVRIIADEYEKATGNRFSYKYLMNEYGFHDSVNDSMKMYEVDSLVKAMMKSSYVKGKYDSHYDFAEVVLDRIERELKNRGQYDEWKKWDWYGIIEDEIERNENVYNFHDSINDAMNVYVFKYKNIELNFVGTEDVKAKSLTEAILKFGEGVIGTYWYLIIDIHRKDGMSFFITERLSELLREAKAGKFNSYEKTNDSINDAGPLAGNLVEQHLKEQERNLSKWGPKEAKIWRETNWKARNYESLIISNNSFRRDVRVTGTDIVLKNVKFVLEISANTIFAPRYVPEGEYTTYRDYCWVADGTKYNGYTVIGRADTWKMYHEMTKHDSTNKLEKAEKIMKIAKLAKLQYKGGK